MKFKIIKKNYKDLPYNPNLKDKARQLRKQGILAEVLFWLKVRNKQFLNLDFDRQKVIGDYIVDFYCKSIGLVVEIDGESHKFKPEYDFKRDEFLKDWGLDVYRISDKDVKQKLDEIMYNLEQYILDNYLEE